MKPRPIIKDDLGYWADHNPRLATFGSNNAGVMPCQALLTETNDPRVTDTDRTWVARVPWTLSDAELEALISNGGTIWVSTWGGLPPHMLEVPGAPS